MATLEKLEQLLVRVQQRAAEPRPLRRPPPESGVSAAGVGHEPVPDSESELPIAQALGGFSPPSEPPGAPPLTLSPALAPAADAGEIDELEELDDIEEYEDELEELSEESPQPAVAGPTAMLASPTLPKESNPLRVEGDLRLEAVCSFETLLEQALQLGE